MRNKILIVDANKDEQELLGQILQQVVAEGGELFFADKREEAIAILKKEHPQVVFLDAPLVGSEEAWNLEGVHIVVMQEKSETNQKSADFVVKPFNPSQVLQKCRSCLNHEPAAPIPPM